MKHLSECERIKLLHLWRGNVRSHEEVTHYLFNDTFPYRNPISWFNWLDFCQFICFTNFLNFELLFHLTGSFEVRFLALLLVIIKNSFWNYVCITQYSLILKNFFSTLLNHTTKGFLSKSYRWFKFGILSVIVQS